MMMMTMMERMMIDFQPIDNATNLFLFYLIIEYCNFKGTIMMEENKSRENLMPLLRIYYPNVVVN